MCDVRLTDKQTLTQKNNLTICIYFLNVVHYSVFDVLYFNIFSKQPVGLVLL